MTIWGVQPTGFNRKLFADILSSIETYQQVNISENIQQQNLIQQAIDQPERSVIGNINYIVTDELSQAWEQLEIAANGLDPDTAIDFMLQGLGRITGLTPEGATAGTVTIQCGLVNGFSAAIGTMVVNQLGFVNNTWRNTAAIGPVTGGAYDVTFAADNLGALGVVGANGFQINGSPLPGWLSVANSEPSTDGQNVESEESFRSRRTASARQTGAGSLAAIVAAVRAVTGVIDATGDENATSVYVRGLPPGSMRVVVWDGAGHAAYPPNIANAIYGARAPGAQTVGAQHAAVEAFTNSSLVSINWDWASLQNVYVTYSITSGAASFEDVVAALRVAIPGTLGSSVVWAKAISSVVSVPGVFDASVQIGLAPSPTGQSNIPITFDQIAILYSVNGTTV